MRFRLFILGIGLLALSNSVVAAEYTSSIARGCPLETNIGINANFGEYRGWDKYVFHDGMDYKAGNFSVSIKRW